MKKKKQIKTIEIEATTREEAIRQALKLLHADKQDVSIKVLKEEHKGLFGMEGAQLAKVKVTLKSHK